MKEKAPIESLKGIPTICLFGPAGSGKGTQARVLSSFSNIFHLSTGDLFRSMPKSHPFFALSSSYIEKGQLVPDEEVMKLVAQYIQGMKDTFAFGSHTLLLDGLPRNINQAQILLDHIDLKATIELEISSQEELLARLLNRAKVEGRSDDANRSSIIERLNIYTQETLPSLKLLEKNSPLNIKVQGCNAPASVSAQILDPLSKLLLP